MAKFPEPPDLRNVAADTVTLAEGTWLWRIYFQGGGHPTTWDGFRHYGPTTARFDHHVDPPRVQERAILYGAHGKEAVTTCLAEVFQATRTIDRTARAPWLVGFPLTRVLCLLDLAGDWPTQAGASMAINSGPRPRARRRSRAIHAAYADIDGLLYASSMHENAPCVALYERAQNALANAPDFHRSLADPALGPRLNTAANRLSYALV